MKFKYKDTGKLFKSTAREWNEKDPFRQSAVIAYYAVFSIPGLLVLIINIAGYFFDKQAVNESILTQIAGTMGSDTADQMKEILIKSSESKATIWSTIIGMLVLVIGATGVFVEMQKTLNQIWEVKAVPKKGIMAFLRSRLFSFGLILAIAFLLLTSLVISAVLAAVSDWIKIDSSAILLAIFNVLNFVISIAVISVLFALMYKILPDAKIKWKDVWFGAFLTGLLFTIGKTALAMYFGKAEPASAYGAAGSVVLILLWVSYSSLIVFFGAQFTAEYSKLYSGKIQPTELAKKQTTAKGV